MNKIIAYWQTAPVWHHRSWWAGIKLWRNLEFKKKGLTLPSFFQLMSILFFPRSNWPLLKSAMHSGLSTRPSPGLDGEMGGEKVTVLLLQSISWSREGSKSGVSSSSIPQSLNNEDKHTPRRDLSLQKHPEKRCQLWKMISKDSDE